MRLFSADAFRRVANVVRTVEKWRPFRRRNAVQVRTGERQRFVVTSDMPTEAITAGTEVFPVTCQAILLRDATRTTSLEFGCFPPGGTLCRDYPPCYRCPITMVSNKGDVLVFDWTRGDYPFSSANPLEYTATTGETLLLFYRGDGTDCCCLMQFSFNGLIYQGQHPGCGTSEFGATFPCLDPDAVAYPCRWTASTDCTDVADPNGTAPDDVPDRPDYDGSPFTLNLSLFGGIPFRGEVVEARNHGGVWYAIGGRNLAILGQRTAGTAPYRLETQACVADTEVPFAYLSEPSPSSIVSGVELGGENAYGNQVGRQHLVKWNEQRRRYELVMSKCTVGVFGTSPQWNPYRRTCNPCGFPCETMPFVFDSGGACPDLDGTYTLTPGDGSGFGCTFSETASYGIYWLSETISAGECSARFAAYCVKDSNAAEGVRWVVEYCCSDGTHLVDSDADLQFVCGVVRYAYSLSGNFGCCCEQPCDTCTPPSTLYADLTSSCSGWSGTVTLTETAGTWQGATGAPDQVVDVQMTCFEGQWNIAINAVNAMCGDTSAYADSWTCTPAFEASFTVPLSADCCPPSGGTLTVEVRE